MIMTMPIPLTLTALIQLSSLSPLLKYETPRLARHRELSTGRALHDTSNITGFHAHTQYANVSIAK